MEVSSSEPASLAAALSNVAAMKSLRFSGSLVPGERRLAAGIRLISNEILLSASIDEVEQLANELNVALQLVVDRHAKVILTRVVSLLKPFAEESCSQNGDSNQRAA